MRGYQANYGEKVKGAYLEEDAPLSDPESALPPVITLRVLWRVAQSQYDPLGLLSVYMVKWKLLMRKVTQGEGRGVGDPAGQGRRGRIQAAAERPEGAEGNQVPQVRATFGRTIQETDAAGLRRRIERGLLHTSLPALGEG
jgi:hypothetical protein